LRKGGETPRQKAIREQREAVGMTSPATPGAAMPATGGATVSTAATKKGDKKKDAAAAELDMGTKKAGTRTRIGATAAAELGTQRVQVDVYLHGTDTVTDALAKSAEIRSSVKAAVSEGLVQANRA
ncbi:MAG: hypothetical protein PHV11_08820, partial [Candidatus Bipolaricaulis sp.]|nr:hypothetical protein [Candidatus Bipolaricaulis sp.]